MFEINEEPKKKIKVFGKEYELSPPTVGQSLSLQMLIDENQGSNSVAMNAMIAMFVESGLPKEVCERIPSNKLAGLAEYLLGSKKN